MLIDNLLPLMGTDVSGDYEVQTCALFIDIDLSG